VFVAVEVGAVDEFASHVVPHLVLFTDFYQNFVLQCGVEADVAESPSSQ
jgi:hypothetical protein